MSNYRNWVCVSNTCNNNCLFCSVENPKDIRESYITKKIKEGKNKSSHLILSGSEPTLNENLFRFIKLAKSLNYEKIHLITNGRLLSNSHYLNKLLAAGLNEITISVHGHNPSIHDVLTQTYGSFKQTLKGIKNVLLYGKKYNFVFNLDIVITKLNYKFLPSMTKFFIGLGVKEIDFINLAPFGNACSNWSKLFCGKKQDIHIIRSIAMCKKKGIIYHLSKFSKKSGVGAFVDREDFVQALSEVLSAYSSRNNLLKKINKCRKKGMCKFCIMDKICNNSYKLKKILRCIQDEK